MTAGHGATGEGRGVVLYGCDTGAVAAALTQLDARFVPAGLAAPGPGQVPVVCCAAGVEADAVREAGPGVAWLVVELYRPGVDVGHAAGAGLSLNMLHVDAAAAARAVRQPDVVVWYEVVNPIRAVVAGDGPVADDYSDLDFVVPDGHRLVAHAVGADGLRPRCLPGDAERVLPSADLWALAQLRNAEQCEACTRRHG